MNMNKQDTRRSIVETVNRVNEYVISGNSALMVLLGKSRYSKTQLATDAARMMLEGVPVKELHRLDQARATPARYAAAFDIILDIRATYKLDSKESITDVIESYADPRLLIIDNFELCGETELENNYLKHLLDIRDREGLSTIIVTDLSRQEFEATLTESARTRMSETGGIVECNWKSFR